MTHILECVTLAGVFWFLVRTASLRCRWRLPEPQLRSAHTSGAATETAGSREESRPRSESAAQPFAGLPEFAERLQASADGFSHRLEHASHNVLQSVDGMREAAAGLSHGTAGLDLCYARLAAMYERFEPLAARAVEGHAEQQQQWAEIAAGLYGITQSLTTVVASANESQAAVSRTAEAVAGALAAVQEGTARMEASVERLATALEASASTEREAGEAPSRESVSLRLMVEQQQQFINLLDQRLSRLDRAASLLMEPARCYSSSSSSSSSSSRSSSSIPSSSAAKALPPRALSNHSM